MFKGWSIEHLIGVKFNRLTILKDLGKIEAYRYCRVMCDCGNIKDIRLSAVKGGTTKSCGCLCVEVNAQTKNIDYLVGQKFNRLTITEILPSAEKKRFCMAMCECGNLRKHQIESLISGGTKSCGCLRTESNLKGHNRTHNLSHHPLWKIWSYMKDRCYCITDPAYPNYGGSGVVMCDEWKNDFKPFYDWAIANGWKKGLQIDKDKLSPYKTGILYSPEYCCFLTRKENMRYRRNSIIIEYKNESKLLIDWCDELKINYELVRRKLANGCHVDVAFATTVIKK